MLTKLGTLTAALITLMIFLPSLSSALCLQNCQQEAARTFRSMDTGPLTDSPYAQRNIRTGDVKNTVFGDMNIRVGHERVDVRTESSSNNNTIDANINSTIILGDMVK